jgi:Uma2 family endonuclease
MKIPTPIGLREKWYGASDLIIELISPESKERDQKTKFEEYRNGGANQI